MQRLRFRREWYDPAKEEWVDEELPTVTVKDAVTVTGAFGAGSALISKTLQGGTVMRVTRLSIRTFLGTPAVLAGVYALIDRDGTFDHIMIEEGTQLRGGQDRQYGAPLEPLYVVGGSFRVVNLGSLGGGSHFISYEGIVPQEGTETR